MPFDIIRNVRAYVYSRDDLSSNEVLVLRILADYANAEGYAWPSLPTLQKATKLKRRAIQYALRSLGSEKYRDRKGEILLGKQLIESILVRGRYGRQTYRLLIPHTENSKGAPHAPIENSKGAPRARKGAPRAHISSHELEEREKSKSSSAREEEDREKAEQSSGEEFSSRFLVELQHWVGKEFYSACANGNGQHPRE